MAARPVKKLDSKKMLMTVQKFNALSVEARKIDMQLKELKQNIMKGLDLTHTYLVQNFRVRQSQRSKLYLLEKAFKELHPIVKASLKNKGVVKESVYNSLSVENLDA